MSDLTGTITSSHDPALPPLPEAILLTHLASSDDRWMAHTCGTVARLTECAEGLTRFGRHSTRIITIQPPPSAREVSDAEVCEIIRDAWTKEQGIECVTADAEIARDFPILFACVRAALKGAVHASAGIADPAAEIAQLRLDCKALAAEVRLRRAVPESSPGEIWEAMEAVDASGALTRHTGDGT